MKGCPTTTVGVAEARKMFRKTIDRVAFGKERILLERHGEHVAAVVPVEDVRLLEELENRIDLAAARRALKEKGSIPWEQIRRELGNTRKQRPG